MREPVVRCDAQLQRSGCSSAAAFRELSARLWLPPLRRRCKFLMALNNSRPPRSRSDDSRPTLRERDDAAARALLGGENLKLLLLCRKRPNYGFNALATFGSSHIRVAFSFPVGQK